MTNHEKEWRLLHEEKNKAFSYERRCLTAVYIGARMPDDLIRVVCHSLENMPTNISRAKLNASKFGLDFVPVDYASIDYRTGAT